MSEGKGHFINGQWEAGGADRFTAINPADNTACWSGCAASPGLVDQAVGAARRAQPAWFAMTTTQRLAIIESFKSRLEVHRAELAEIISQETGKPRWEADSEVGAMIGKIPLTQQAHEQRHAEQTFEIGNASAALGYRPHGVLAVFGPFNLPGHLPNGHIVPALLAGNTIVFKPSEQTPLIGQRVVELWQAAGLPAGVLNMVQGAKATGAALAEHPGHDGILFTGSYAVGAALARALVASPQKILALEMGGNNPLVVHEVADVDAAAYTAIQSAYITAGQRCTDARRLIVVQDDAGDRFVQRLSQMISRVRFGLPEDEPEPFYGPLINIAAADHVLAAQASWLKAGGRSLVEAARSSRCAALVSPGLIDMTQVQDRPDDEVFGPLLQVIRVPDFEAAITEANCTRYGLSAALLSDRRALFDTFASRVRAGIINWNRPTSGASGRLPFGGVGKSGNHRPSGFFAIDYCAYPVASVQQEVLTRPQAPAAGLESVFE